MSDELWVLKRKATLLRILANERAQALSGGIGTEVRDTLYDTLAEFAEAVAQLAQSISPSEGRAGNPATDTITKTTTSPTLQTQGEE